MKITVKPLPFLAVLLLIVAAGFSGCKQEEFSFIQVCDPQLGMGGYAHDVGTLVQAVAQINEMNCDFVVFAGDLVHHASDSAFDRFLSIIGELDIPFYLVPGNHDVGNIPNDSTLSYYREKLGADYYTFTHGGYAFVMVNSQLWKNHIGEESDLQQTWLEHTLDSLREDQKPIVVVGHHPMFIAQVDEEEQYSNLPAEKREELLNLFAVNNVKAYLSGHRHETLVNRFKDIQLVTGETTSKNFDNRPTGFRLWNVSADTVMHRFIPVSN